MGAVEFDHIRLHPVLSAVDDSAVILGAVGDGSSTAVMGGPDQDAGLK